MYGYVLSSRSTTLNFGRYCLIRLCSSAKASRALATRMVSRSAISRANDPVLALTQLDSRKYERTRLRREIAWTTDPLLRVVPYYLFSVPQFLQNTSRPNRDDAPCKYARQPAHTTTMILK